MSTPPPYTDITGISRAVMKDNAQESLAGYNGNARPGELVVNLETNPPALYVGNNAGQLTAITSGSGSGLPVANGSSNFDIAAVDSNATVTVDGTYTWTFDTTGRLLLPESSEANVVKLTSPPNNANVSLQLYSGNAVRIVSNTTGEPFVWTFGATGAFTAPGNITAVNVQVTGQNDKFITAFGTLGYNSDRGAWGLEATGGFGTVDLTSATIDGETGNITARYTASLTNDGRFRLPVSSTANISQLTSAPNNANASLRLTGGNAVEIVSDGQTNNHTWTFDANGDLTIPGRLILASGGVQETFQSKTDATGVVTHDCALGHIFYHTSPDANWTANFTNLNLASSTSTNLVLVIEQGATPYYPSAVQIGGAAQTIKWLGNVTPTPSANKTEIATFTIFSSGSGFVVLGSYSTYG